MLRMVQAVLRRSGKVQATRKEKNEEGKRGEKCENFQVKISPGMGRKTVKTYPGLGGGWRHIVGRHGPRRWTGET